MTKSAVAEKHKTTPSFSPMRRGLTVLAGASLAGGFGIARAQARRVVLGQSAPFSGVSEQLGVQFHTGAKLLFDQINARGGVNGSQIELRALDDGYEPDRCVSNTEQLIKNDVLALFGYVGTPTSLAALPLALAKRMPFVAPFTGAMALRQPFRREIFHLRASYDDETALIVKQLLEVGQERVGVFYQHDSYGEAGLSGVTKALAARQLKPIATGTVERNSVDVADAVRKLTHSDVQAIVQIGAYKSCAAFIRAARKAGYAGPFYNVSFVGTQALIDELGSDGRGVLVTQVMPNPYSLAKPIAREFAAAIAAGGNKVQANYSSMEGFLAARLFVESLRRIDGGPTREKLVTALESINEDFGGYHVKFGPTDHVASRFVELSILTGDGRLKT